MIVSQIDTDISKAENQKIIFATIFTWISFGFEKSFDMCDIASNLASNHANTYETIMFTVCEYQNNTLINIIAFVYAIIFGRVGAHHL